MISYKELLGKHNVAELPIAHQHNLEDLLKAVNKLRAEWGKPLIVTSGYRSEQDHLRIYSQIAAKKGVQFDASKVPMGSKHLIGGAVDFADPDGSLYDWIELNPGILDDCELWSEEGTKVGRWVHVQCLPFSSYKTGGTRWFKP
jgi:hypothetical protein